MFTTLTQIQKAMILAVIGYSGFAVSDAAVKWLTQTYPVFQSIVIIKLFAAGYLLLLSPWIGHKESVFKIESKKIHILRIMLNFLVSVMVVFSFSHMPLPSFYALVFVLPFFAILLSVWLYGEKLKWNRSVAILVGFAGVLVVIRPGVSILNPWMILPVASALLAALLFIVSRSLESESIFSLGFYPAFGTGLLCIPFALSGPVLIPELSDLPLFMISGAGIFTGLICVSLAFRMGPGASVSPFHYTQIIWGILFGYFIFGEFPDLLTFIGAGIIILSGLYLVQSERKSLGL